MTELTKSQKKIARELINLGLQREYLSFKNEITQFVNNSKWEASNPKEFYHQLYKKVNTFDVHIGKRYDYLTGSHYFNTVLSLIYDKILTQEDIERFDDEVQNEIVKMQNFWAANK
jgi:hypothetical protein